MRHSAAFVVLLALITLASVLAAPAAYAKEEPWEQAFVQGKRQQDEALFSAAKSAGTSEKVLMAKVETLVARYRKAMQTQGSALSHYLYGRILFKQSEAEGLKDERKKADALRAMQAAQSRGAGWFAAYAQAYIHFKTNDPDRGEAFLAQLLRTHGERPEVMALHARLLLARSRFAELKTLAEKLIKQNANNLAARELLAMAYMGLKDWPRAERAIDSMTLRGDDRLEPRLWKIEAIVQQKAYKRAEKEILVLIKGRPKNVGLRLVYVDILVDAKDLKRATTVMKQVVQYYPKHIGYLGRLSELYLQDKKPKEAEAILLRALALCEAAPKQSKAVTPFVLRNLAFAAYSQKRYASVVKYLEDLERLADLAPHLLDLQQQCYARLKRVQDRIRVLKKLRKHMDGRPDDRKKLDQLIDALQRGETAPGTASGEELWGQSQMAELIERCSHKDAKIRREALSQYYQLDLPFVDPVVYQRHDHRIEPDPDCRRLVVQVLGRFRVNDANAEIVRIASRYVGFALEDPDQDVRMIAAQELGRIGTPAGIIYLMPYLEHMPLDTSKLTATSRKELEKEYNSARATLSTLTGREDIEPGAPNWIDIAKAPAHRQGWLAWYDGPEGADVRMRALADLDTIERVGPRWPLRFLLSDLMKKPRRNGRRDPGESFTDTNGNGGYDPAEQFTDENGNGQWDPAEKLTDTNGDGVWNKAEPFEDQLRTTPTQVWVRTYQLLRRHILRVKQKDPAKFAADKWWPTFPIYADETLKLPDAKAEAETRIAKLRAELTAWWQGLPK